MKLRKHGMLLVAEEEKPIGHCSVCKDELKISPGGKDKHAYCSVECRERGRTQEMLDEFNQRLDEIGGVRGSGAGFARADHVHTVPISKLGFDIQLNQEPTPAVAKNIKVVP